MNIDLHAFDKKWFFYLATLIFLAVAMNVTWSSTSILWWGSIGLLVFTFFFMKGNAKIQINGFLIWMLVFIAWGFCTGIYAKDSSLSTDMAKNLTIYFILILIVMNGLLGGYYSVNRFLGLIFLAVFINGLYLLATADLSAVMSGTAFGNSTNSGWNSNSIGMMMTVGIMIGIYLIELMDRRWMRSLAAIMVVVMIFIALFTGSRKVIGFLIIGFAIYFCARAPQHIIRNIILIAILVVVLYIAVMKIPKLYEVIGNRLEGLIAAMTGNTKNVDSSTELRQLYIRNGVIFWKRKPLFGYGLDNYRVLNKQATGRMTYSHNNFIETLVDLGLAGFVYYYSIFAYIIVKLVKKCAKSHLAASLLALFTAYLVCHYGMVTYSEMLQNILLGTAVVFIVQSDRQES